MIIRKATKEDAKNIASLAVQVWLDTYAVEGIRDTFSEYIWSELTPENFSEKIENDKREIFLLWENEHLIGFAEMNYDSHQTKSSKDDAEIDKLYIQENFCGKGLGKELINHIRKECKVRGVKEVWLSVYENNRRAIGFYEKVGFTETGELFFRMGDEKHRNLILALSM